MTPPTEPTMSGEELDRARVCEAVRLHKAAYVTSPGVAQITARLAREGWTPPDRIESTHVVLMQKWNASGEDYRVSYIVREALKLGIEIGREQSQ